MILARFAIDEVEDVAPDDSRRPMTIHGDNDFLCNNPEYSAFHVLKVDVCSANQ